MSYYTTISIKTNKDLIEILDIVIEKYKENIEVYTYLVRLKESILNYYIKEYYISKYTFLYFI